MKKVFKGVLAALMAGSGGAVWAAETVAYWAFDDGAPTNVAGAVATEVNAPALNGTAGKNLTGALPTFSADCPAPRLYASLTGPLLNPTNSASLRFVNAGLPADTNSHAGGIVTVPDNDPLLRATNLTVEAFIKVDRHVNFPLVIGKARADGGGTSWNIDFDGSGKPRVRIDSTPIGVSSGSGWNQSWTSSVGVEDGRWHHLAFTYTHTNRAVKLYVDGAVRVNATSFSNLVYDTRELRIGQGAGGRAFDGWIDEIRITPDVLLPDQFMTAVATTSTRGYWMFEDAAAGVTANVLTNDFYAPLMHGTAGTVYGGSVKPAFSAERPPCNSSRISDGAGGPVVNGNDGSLLFVNAGLPDNVNSQSGGVVTVAGSRLCAQATNFTAEAFVKVNRHVNFPQIIGKTRSGGLSWSLALNASGHLRARFDTQIPPGTTGNNQTFETSAKIEDGQWHHVALSYDAPTRAVRLYKDYVKVHEGTTVNPLWLDGGDLQIGAGDMAFDGWIDEVRLTDRVLEPSEFLYTVPLAGTLISVQ
jgi:hypothetical protein